MTFNYDKDKIKFYREVNLKPSLMGPTAGNNIKPGSISMPRLHMSNSQFGQKPAILHGQPPKIFTGFEREHAKHLLTIKTECDCIVRSIITRNPIKKQGQNPPNTIVVIERLDTGQIDYIEVPQNNCKHQTFGFQYVRTDVMKNLYIGESLEEGTILAKPPTLNDDGDWCYGRNVLMALIPSEVGIEDGLGISESLAKKFELHGYGTIEASFGKNRFLLNTHGDEQKYKPFLHIGEKIPDTGTILSIRKYEPDLALTNMTQTALRHPNTLDDTKSGVVGATIVDVRVTKGNPQICNLPKPVAEWVDVYWEKYIAFRSSICKTHQQLKKTMGGGKHYPATSRWNQLVADSMFVELAKGGAKKEKFRNAPCDETHISVQYEYVYTPNLGTKFTCRNAGKAVVCDIIPDHLMPLDCRGRRVEAIMDVDASMSRMNTPRNDEIALNACSETCLDEIRDAYEVEHNLNKAWSILQEFYDCISPAMSLSMEGLSTDQKIEDIEDILKPQEEQDAFNKIAGIRLGLPSDNPVDWVEAIDHLEKRFPPLKGPMTFFDADGNPFQSEKDILVSHLYLMVLERAAQSYAATSSAKRQPYGVPVKASKSEKNSSPISDSATKTNGEDEERGHLSLIGPLGSRETFDRNLNPQAHRELCRSIYHSENPARIRNAVPRTYEQIDPTVPGQKVVPLKGGRVHEILRHTQRCGGYAHEYGEDGDKV